MFFHYFDVIRNGPPADIDNDPCIILPQKRDISLDALSLINTITGMKIDIHKRTFALANKTGGLSGPAIKPVAVRMVYQAAKAVKIPIIGMGGIANAEDAIEFMLAGAVGVAVGAMNFVNFLRIHKSYLVNASYISGYSRDYVTLTTGERLRISRYESRVGRNKKRNRDHQEMLHRRERCRSTDVSCFCLA